MFSQKEKYKSIPKGPLNLDISNEIALNTSENFSEEIKSVLSKFCWDERRLPNKELILHNTSLASDYYATLVINTFKEHLPNAKNTLRVLSLACGEPNDYLALSAVFARIQPDCRIHYVGVDIDAAHNDLLRSQYQNIPHVSIVTADCSDALKTLNEIARHNVLPAMGFDVIFLRHPDVNSVERGAAFELMLTQIIPLLAGMNCPVIVSTFFAHEMQTVYDHLVKTGTNVYRVPKRNYIEANGGLVTTFSDGDKVVADKYNMVVMCQGLQQFPSLSAARDTLNRQAVMEGLHQMIPPTPANNMLRLALANKKFDELFYLACQQARLGLVKVLLEAQELLALNINAVSPDQPLTALDMAESNRAEKPPIKDAIVKLIISAGGQHARDIINQGHSVNPKCR